MGGKKCVRIKFFFSFHYVYLVGRKEKCEYKKDLCFAFAWLVEKKKNKMRE